MMIVRPWVDLMRSSAHTDQPNSLARGWKGNGNGYRQYGGKAVLTQSPRDKWRLLVQGEFASSGVFGLARALCGRHRPPIAGIPPA